MAHGVHRDFVLLGELDGSVGFRKVGTSRRRRTLWGSLQQALYKGPDFVQFNPASVLSFFPHSFSNFPPHLSAGIISGLWPLTLTLHANNDGQKEVGIYHAPVLFFSRNMRRYLLLCTSTLDLQFQWTWPTFGFRSVRVWFPRKGACKSREAWYTYLDWWPSVYVSRYLTPLA